MPYKTKGRKQKCTTQARLQVRTRHGTGHVVLISGVPVMYPASFIPGVDVDVIKGPGDQDRGLP